MRQVICPNAGCSSWLTVAAAWTAVRCWKCGRTAKIQPFSVANGAKAAYIQVGATPGWKPDATPDHGRPKEATHG
jgi:hypothetical protein